MTKRKAYAKPRIAVEDFVLNQFIAGSCQIKTKEEGWMDLLDNSPLYADMMKEGFFVTGVVNSCARLYALDDDTLCYHNQGSPLFTS